MPLLKFESMLKTDNVFFFDTTEFEEIIQHYLNMSKLALANKAIQLGLEQHPASISLKLLKVELYVFEDNLTNAVELLSEIEHVSPHNDEVLIQKATICSKENKHVEAVKLLKQSLEFTEDPVDVWALIGMEYLYLEEYENALLNFAKCLEVDFDDHSSLYNVIYCFEMQDDFEGAAMFLNTFLDKNPYCEIAWHQLGRQYFELKEYEKAINAFDYAILVDDSFIGGYLEKSKTLEKLEKYEEAVANYLITLELDDPTAYAYFRIGVCYEKLNDFNSAVSFYKKALHEDPFLDNAWVSLSDIYYNAGDYTEANYYIKKALETDDFNILFWHKYADINVELNLHKEAIKGFYRCLELGDAVIGTYVSLVDLLLSIKEFDNALEVLELSRKHYDGFVELEYRFAVLFFLVDKKEFSYLHLKNALAIDLSYLTDIKKVYPTLFGEEEIKDIISNFKTNIN